MEAYVGAGERNRVTVFFGEGECFHRQGCFSSELLLFIFDSTCYQTRWPQLAFSFTGFK